MSQQAASAARFTDADLRRYLAARAAAVSLEAVGADEMATRVAVQLGLLRSRRSRPARVVRLAVVVALLAALVAGALYIAGRLRERYAPAQPEITVNLHSAPWAVAALDGSIWTAGYLGPVLFQVEPTTGKVLREIPTGKRTCGELAAAFGFLWFTTCPPNAFLGRVDPATGHIDRLNGYGADQLGFDEGLVWLPHDGELEGLDPATLATARRIPLARAGLSTFGFGSVWIADTDGGEVARVSLATGGETAAITWEVAEGQAYPVHLVVGDGAVWVVDELALAVYRIDPATNATAKVDVALQVIDGTGFGDHPIAFGAGQLWVRETETSIARIDTAALAVAERVTTGPFGGGAFVVTEDAFWYTNLKGGSLVGLQRTRP